ncbi:MAG: sel1 repeat family protein [Opitutaceae bacterium]|nr:sel1 repeat family protein [Verrucomicrobiales bacterium]
MQRFIWMLTLECLLMGIPELSAQTNVVTPALVEETKARAEKGDAEAQVKLGFYYGRGLVVAQDYTESTRWYRKAADQGHAAGQYNLGMAYAKNKGAPQNPAEAVRWVRKAADQGYAPAQYGLGSWYAYGQNVGKDVVEAHKWYSLALAQGDGSSKATLENLEKEMSPEQIRAAQQKAGEFKPVKSQ